MRSLLLLVLVSVTVLAAAMAPSQNAFTPDKIQYGSVASFIPPGAQLAVLEGDPTASSGDFTVRLKMPDGYKIPPHWHPHRENVTVISGNFKVGMGDTFDATKMATFGTGQLRLSRSQHASLCDGQRSGGGSSARHVAAAIQLR